MVAVLVTAPSATWAAMADQGVVGPGSELDGELVGGGGRWGLVDHGAADVDEHRIEEWLEDHVGTS